MSLGPQSLLISPFPSAFSCFHATVLLARPFTPVPYQ
jgi:hypothetical protein